MVQFKIDNRPKYWKIFIPIFLFFCAISFLGHTYHPIEGGDPTWFVFVPIGMVAGFVGCCLRDI